MIFIEKEIRYFSMFTGVGGFELGLERAADLGWLQQNNVKGEGDSEDSQKQRGNGDSGKFSCVGFSEIDKYANQLLAKRFPNIPNFGDAAKINPAELPDFDMLCGGFPCQSFSIAGKRRGFEDTRGTMFFEISRILEAKRPELVFLENVKGLLNHDKGETFKVILQTLEELGYEIQWMVLNSKFFGVAQNRERVFIVGSLGGTSRPEILPFRIINKETNGMEQEEKMITYPTLSTELAHSTGRDFFRNGGMKIIQAQKSDREIGRIYNPEGIAPTLHLKTGGWQEPKIAIPVLTPDRLEKRQNGRRFKENGDESFTLTKTDIHGVSEGMKVRRLTPIEYERLQGFPDNYTEGFSDTQRYRMVGNAVTVNVIEAIGRKLLKQGERGV